MPKGSSLGVLHVVWRHGGRSDLACALCSTENLVELLEVQEEIRRGETVVAADGRFESCVAVRWITCLRAHMEQHHRILQSSASEPAMLYFLRIAVLNGKRHIK